MTGLFERMRFHLGTQRQMLRAGRSLRKTAKRAGSLDDVVAAAFTTAGTSVPVAPLQVASELTRLAELVSADKPLRVLEIGTGNGGTLFALAWASAPGARILSIDLTIYPTERRILYRTFAADRRVDVWAADSHLEATRDRVAAHFGQQPLDLVFIDGDHTYDSVRRDYELYAPLVREGGIIAFHDIVDGRYEAVGDVPRFWREVQPNLTPTAELVESWHQGGFGIGVGRRHDAAHPVDATKSPRPSTSR
jgi:predicted O-methyltransferase YrrM